MTTVLTKKRAVVAVDLSDDLTTKAVLVSGDGERFLLERCEFYSEQSSGAADLTQGWKPEAVTAVLGDGHTLCFAAPELDDYNIEIEKRKCGVSAETQISDYLNVSRSSLLAAVQRETAEEVLSGVKATFPGVSRITVSQIMASLLYVYLRAYRPQREMRSAVLHCTSEIVSLLVIQTEMPVWEGSIDVKPGDKEGNYSEICALLQAANEKFGGGRCDLLLLGGDCDAEDVQAMKGFADQVELLSPFRNGAFELCRSLGNRRQEALQNGHRLAAAIGGAGMLLEGVGLNLAETDVKLEKAIPLERIAEKDHTALGIAVEGARLAARKAGPFLLAQSRILFASVLIALAMFGCRFYEASKESSLIDAEIAFEQQRAASLAETRAQLDEFKSKVAAINARTAAIAEIGKNQLTVKTILDELDQRIPKGLVFTELEVEETEIKLKGYAPEKPAVTAFATRLGQSLGVFSNVVPVYDDKTNIGSYQIACKYIGPIQSNQMAAAKQNPETSWNLK